ncbi:MAG: hypothetical protein HKN19_15110, partial [Halioglobus sp.]|nr:hypothetical protein [Halioglobus sp.]
MSFGDIVRNFLSRDGGKHELPPPQDNPGVFLETLAGTLPDSLQWSTDERVGGLLAVFEMDAAEQLMTLLTQQLGDSWERK